MTNDILELPEGDEASDAFDYYLDLPDRVFFVILGDSDDHHDLIEQARGQAHNWRWVIWARDPMYIYPRLLSLPLRPGVLPIIEPWPPTILAVSISINNYICRVVKSSNGNVVSPAFMLAETFMQP